MPTGFADTDLPSRLPDLRGRLTPNAPLADQTWFRVGGPAEVLYRPADEQDLAHFMTYCPPDVPITVLGAASNTLVRDGGVPGVVIRFGAAFGTLKILDGQIRAGAGCIDLNVARAAQGANIAGMEFLYGIPGTVGGGLRMNAGAYKREFKDIVVSVDMIMRGGARRTLGNAEMDFSYRHCGVAEDAVFISALLQGEAGDPNEIKRRMDEIQRSRSDSQPIRERTGGSTFANPDNDPRKRKSWQLIDAAGCRGLHVGGAMVSEKHCNFLINNGHATAHDIEKLGEEVRRRVRETSGIDLRWEIRRIGNALPP